MTWLWGLCIAVTVAVWCAATAADTIDRRRWEREREEWGDGADQ